MNELPVPLEQLLKASNGSIYKLAILVAKRAIDLTDGESPMVERATEKVLDNALREIEAGKIRVKKEK